MRNLVLYKVPAFRSFQDTAQYPNLHVYSRVRQAFSLALPDVCQYSVCINVCEGPQAEVLAQRLGMIRFGALAFRLYVRCPVLKVALNSFRKIKFCELLIFRRKFPCAGLSNEFLLLRLCVAPV